MNINTDAVMVFAAMVAATCLGTMGIASWMIWRDDRESDRRQAAFERKLEELLRR